jgi:hypothetical protein
MRGQDILPDDRIAVHAGIFKAALQETVVKKAPL